MSELARLRAHLRVAPIYWVAAIAIASTAVRTAAALRVRTPFFLPDEYLYSAMARSIAATGVPRVRGSLIDFPWLLGPVLMAPAWLVHDVSLAYRLAQSLGAVWFSLAAFPAYLLARRLGVSAHGAILVALLAVLIPDGAFAMGLLTEPYAYPIFLTTVLVALEACVKPTFARQLTAVVAMLALCLVRAQFLPIWGAYLVTALAAGRGPIGTRLRDHRLVLGTMALATATVLAFGTGRFTGVYSGLVGFRYPVKTIAESFGINVFVLAIAAGWVIVPGAALGLGNLLRDAASRSRAYATLTIALLVALLLEAAVFAPNSGGHVLERYTFYTAPLVAIAFMWQVESHRPDRHVAVLSYAALAVVLLLGTALDKAASGESPTLLAFTQLPGATVHTPALVWAPLLGAASVVTALARHRPHVCALLAVVVAASLSVAAAKWFVDEAGVRFEAAPRVTAPAGAALLTYPEADESFLLETLFWAPQISRVLVVGGTQAADGFAAVPVTLDPRHGVVDAAHAPVKGPFVVGNDAEARLPRVVVFGLYRKDGELSYIGRFVASAGTKPTAVMMRLRSLSGTRTLTFLCTGAPRRRDVAVGPGGRHVRFVVPPETTEDCRFTLIRGTPERLGLRIASRIELERLHVTPGGS